MNETSSNLVLYEKVRSVPDNAKKTIEGGRLKGKTDINPMWRIKMLTEQFGPCGIGWKPKIVRTWLDNGANGEITANVEIELYVKSDGQWSEAIPGLGGSMFVSKESGGFYTDDECYKKAYTDALSVACKALGIGADVYWEKDSSKYGSHTDGDKKTIQQQGPHTTAQKKTKFAQVNDLIKNTDMKMSQITDWIIKKFEKNIKINDLTDEQFEILMKALKKELGVADEQ